jgi:ABC-type nitrate/sulfonate/bicarbonate transport system substrate-binding protein
MVVARSLMKTNPQLVENVARATVEGVAFVLKPANKEIVLKSLARNLRLSKQEQVEKAYQNMIAELPKEPCPTMKGVASVIKLMAEHGLNPKAAQMKPTEIADLSLCKKFEDTGFFRSLY